MMKLKGDGKVRDDFWFLRKRADVLKCCGNPNNLAIIEVPGGSELAICKVCGRRHRRLIAEPGTILTKATLIG